jgi:hypothetical protein
MMAKKTSKAKKKTTKNKFQDVIGTPTMVLLPSRKYKFKVFDKVHSIKVPRQGNYVDIDKKAYTEEDGEFDLLQYSEKEQAHILYLPAVSNVLFATNQYPDMKDGHAFVPVALVFRDDEVEILGNLIEMVQKEN